MVSLFTKKLRLITASFLLVLCVSAPARGSGDGSGTSTLSIVDGLASNYVNCIFQDSQGFMWFGTENGLSRYDGHRFCNFKSNYLTPGFFTGNSILTLAEDGRSRLWIGTTLGLNILDLQSSVSTADPFRELKDMAVNSIVTAPDGSAFIGTDKGLYRVTDLSVEKMPLRSSWGGEVYVKSLFLDSYGYLWIGAWNDGYMVCDISTGEFLEYEYLNEYKNLIVSAFFEDSDRSVWISTWDRHGVFRISDPHTPELSEVQRYIPVSKSTSSQPPVVFAITQNGSGGDIWLATANGIQVVGTDGIGVMNKSNTDRILVDEIVAVYRDRTGLLWYSMNGAGVNKTNLRESGFSHYYLTSLLDDPNLLSSVTSLYEDRYDNLWIGLKSLGLGIYNKAAKRFTLYKDHPQLKSLSPRINSILAFHGQRKFPDRLLMGSRYDGLYQIIYNNGKMAGIMHPEIIDLPYPSYNFTIFAIQEDYNNTIWLGTSEGLIRLHVTPDGDISGGDLVYPGEGREKVPVTSLVVDVANEVWAGTPLGIFRMSHAGVPAAFYSAADKTLNVSETECLYIDRRHRLWAGTRGGGLSRYEVAEDSFVPVDNMELFPDDAIYGIEEDYMGNLWLSTGNGLICYNPDVPDSRQIRPFTISDGLGIYSFNPNASMRSYNNELSFGGSNGFISFYPPEIVGDQIAYPPAITGLMIDNQSVGLMGREEQKKFVSSMPPFTKTVTLPYRSKTITIDFSVLDFDRQNTLNYSYMMSGIDEDWVYADSGKNSVNYNSLSTGKHTFRIRASYNNGVWSPETTLEISAAPAPWNTWWAYLAYLVATAVALFLAYRFTANKVKYKHDLAVEQLEREKSEKIYHEKMVFFTNISHEFFTPVTIAMCALSEMAKRHPEEMEVTEVMGANLNRLSKLLEQIVEFRRIETGNSLLKVSRTDIVAFVRNICSMHFSLLAGSSQITLEVDAREDAIEGYVDRDKLDKIIYNLLSNALKYNKEQGRVRVTMEQSGSEDDGSVLIKVEDSGVGMDRETMERAFEPFYDGNRNTRIRSMGIGLSLVRDLVAKHTGTIGVQSEEGVGSTFTLCLPISRRHYENLAGAQVRFVSEPDRAITEGAEELPEVPSGGGELPALLFVEDNSELLAIIRRSLSDSFRVLTASNGKEAIAAVESNAVDIIVTDIVMPEMNGLELIRVLKLNVAYSHIPVIMLTARRTAEQQVEGFETGADSYLTKPFEMDVLRANIKSLLRNREAVADSFRRSTDDMPLGSVVYNQMDREFLDRVIAYIEQRVIDGDDNIQVIDLYGEFNLSQSAFYRKLRALINMSPNDLIRKIRMQAACRMLVEKGMNVSEVCYYLGFSDPKYFSTVFRKEIGVTPSEYIRSKKSERE